jgi:2-oxoglutarate dehydrogenase E2 component (dihydrolipoamide succinyltransferase)
VSVGTELAVIEESGSGGGETKQPEPEAKPEEPAAPAPAAGNGDGQAAAKPEPAAPQPAPQPAPARAPQPVAAAAGVQAPERGPRSHILSPLVRRLAEENNIDVNQVPGTGTGGRITKKDILGFIDSGGAAAAATQPAPQLQAVPQPQMTPLPEAAPAAGEAERVEDISHIRKRIAENMVASLHQSARAWNLVEVNFENIVRLRAKAKDRFKEIEGISLTYMPFLARAVCDALRAYPDVNAKLDLEAGTATYRNFVNLGVAVAYEDGLIVPVVRKADEMNLVGLARAVNDIAIRARSKKLKPDEVHGGTFTITNPGPFGSLISVPIMNPGETAILAFDAIEQRPVAVDGMIGIRHMCYLSMSWDHRMIDGATAAQFLGRLKQNLETWDFTPEVQAYFG